MRFAKYFLCLFYTAVKRRFSFLLVNWCWDPPRTRAISLLLLSIPIDCLFEDVFEIGDSNLFGFENGESSF